LATLAKSALQFINSHPRLAGDGQVRWFILDDLIETSGAQRDVVAAWGVANVFLAAAPERDNRRPVFVCISHHFSDFVMVTRRYRSRWAYRIHRILAVLSGVESMIRAHDIAQFIDQC
jgi:hypothetical protein